VSDLPSYPQDAAEREAAQPSGGEREYASWGRRLAAYLLDTIILVLPPLVLVVAVVVADPADDSAAWYVALLAYVAWFVLPFVYFTFFHGDPRGQTPGKRALGIRVVSDMTGEPIGYGRAFGRYVMTVVFGFLLMIPWLLDYLWPLWDRKNQSLHDKIVGSVVVRA
jgi:uncharacterized RDD family membrane protein YckC